MAHQHEPQQAENSASDTVPDPIHDAATPTFRPASMPEPRNAKDWVVV